MKDERRQIFKVTETGIKAAVRKYLGIVLITITLIVVLVSITGKFEGNLDKSFLYMVFGVIAAILAIFVGLAVQQIKNILKSYTLFWDSLTVTRIQKGQTDLVLYHGEIKSIGQTITGGLIIRSNNNDGSILIPNGIERKEELKSLLSLVQPITPFSVDAKRSINLGFTIVANLTFITTCLLAISHHLWWLAIVAILINVIQFFRIRRNNNYTIYDRRFARFRIIWLGLCLLRVIPDHYFR